MGATDRQLLLRQAMITPPTSIKQPPVHGILILIDAGLMYGRYVWLGIG